VTRPRRPLPGSGEGSSAPLGPRPEPRYREGYAFVLNYGLPSHLGLVYCSLVKDFVRGLPEPCAGSDGVSAEQLTHRYTYRLLSR